MPYRHIVLAGDSIFDNDVICAEAAARGVPVLRLDRVCVEGDDFSAVSPIEPSAQGGQKIVDHILAHL